MSKETRKIKVLKDETLEFEDLFIDPLEFSKPYIFSRDREVEWILENELMDDAEMEDIY